MAYSEVKSKQHPFNFNRPGFCLETFRILIFYECELNHLSLWKCFNELIKILLGFYRQELQCDKSVMAPRWLNKENLSVLA